jgi:hypothetical protein
MTPIRPDRRVLYTEQGFDLRKFVGPLRPDLATYKDDPEIRDAQRLLYELLGTDQAIWCLQSPPITDLEPGTFRHTIDPDPRDIVAVIDYFHWSRILGFGTDNIPREEDVKLMRQAANRSGDYRNELDLCRRDYLLRHTVEDPWTAVVKDQITKESDQVLLRFPFACSLIRSVHTTALPLKP